MKKSPPDFTKLFFDSLGGVPAPIRYPLRPGPCLLHDLTFLSSLLHDARVLNPYSNAVDGAFKMRFNRDCWELGFKNNELHIANLTLTCHGFRSVSWDIPEAVKEPWLDYLWLDEACHTEKPFRFFLRGERWHCNVLLQKGWSVLFEDEEKPYLWSTHNE